MSESTDIRITPKWLLDVAREFAGGPFALDPCTEADNPTEADSFLTEKHNGLAVRWCPDGGTVWCNPPYSRGSVITWAHKAVKEARDGAEILFLTKDDCRTGWNAYLKANADARCRIARGVGFLEPDEENGGYTQLVGPMWGSCLWMFGRRRRRFDRVFSPIGEIVHGLGPLEELHKLAYCRPDNDNGKVGS